MPAVAQSQCKTLRTQSGQMNRQGFKTGLQNAFFWHLIRVAVFFRRQTRQRPQKETAA